MIKSALFCTLCLFSQALYAAKAQSGPTCQIIGRVKEVQTRKFEYKPESWRKSWDLPKYKIYYDATLEVLKSKEIGPGYGDCQNLKSKKVFQLKDKKSVEVGRCFKAESKYSGDEFSIGQWLYELEYLPDSKCQGQ